MKDTSAWLDLGWKNYVRKDTVLMILDAKTTAARKLKAKAKDKEFGLIDLSSNRKGLSLILITGNRIVISAIPRMQLIARFDAKTTHEEPLVRKRGRPRKDEQSQAARSS